MFVERVTSALPFAILCVVAPIAGVIVVRLPLLGALAIIAIVAVIILISLDNESAIRKAALAVSALIIIYPALLPRSQNQLSVVAGGEFSLHAQIEAAIIIGIAAAAGWLWLSTPRFIAVFTRRP